MEVRPGYKQPEVGGIPEGWQVKRLGDVAVLNRMNVVPALQPDKSFFHFSIPAFDAGKSAQLELGASIGSNKLGVPPTAVLVSKLNPRIPRTWAPSIVPENSVASTEWLVLTPRDGLAREYLLVICTSPLFFERMQLAATGTTGSHQRISPDEALNIQVRIATDLEEQSAIATALSDVDALLGGLDRLIAKKRDLKQAAMQQLLTGQTRLPGFQGEWEVKRLGDHVTFLRNGVNSRAELLLEGRVKYLHYGDIHASMDSFLSPQTLPSLPEAKAARLDRLRDGDVIFADASEDIAGVCKSVELLGARDTEVVSGLHTIAARFDKTVLADGFKGFLQHCPSFATHLRRLAAGTKVYATNRAHIASVEMRLPAVAEQIAIAAVLSDMDAELAALEARREKTRALKQGMMQELLTGRTRLV